jgi:hypothetical protein
MAQNDLLNTLLNIKGQFQATSDRLSVVQKLKKPIRIDREITIIGGLLAQASDSAMRTGDKKLVKTISDAAGAFSFFVETFDSGRSYLNELDFIDKIERAAGRVSVKTLKGKTADDAEPKITKREANIKAREILKNMSDADIKKLTCRELGVLVGCSKSLADELPVFKAVQEALGKGKYSKPKEIRLSRKLEAVTGTGRDGKGAKAYFAQGKVRHKPESKELYENE